MKAAIEFSPPALCSTFSEPSGVSQEAIVLSEGWRLWLREDILVSVALGSQYRQLEQALAELENEAAVADWDGNGAAPIDQKALDYARRIAEILPVTIPAPEVCVDPDGEVAFDWYVGPKQSLSLSVSPAGVLQYASLCGSSELSGLEPWRDEFPESIARVLQRIVAQEKDG